jgi:proline iminopeptidase
MNIRTGFIPLGIEDQLYYEDIGDQNLPALFFIHGGPGLGCEEKHRSQFNLSKYRVVLFDQRGCNRSEPAGDILQNTTQLLVQDIETLRKRLRIEKIILLGSSWGAVLALQYAAKFSERVEKIILKSPFWAQENDFRWSYTQQGAAQKLTQAWKDFASCCSLEGGWPLVNFYAEKILSESPDHEALARWVNWEGALYFAERSSEQSPVTASTLSNFWINVSKIQIHYLKNNFFLNEKDVEEAIQKIRSQKIQTFCLQGNNDWVTPLEHLKKIQKIWPELEVKIIEGADHKIPEEELKLL